MVQHIFCSYAGAVDTSVFFSLADASMPSVAPPGNFIGGGAKGGGVCGGAPENFSSAMPSSLAINVTNAAPFIC